MMLTRHLAVLLAIALAGCATHPTAPPTQSGLVGQTQPLPPNVRPDLAPKWVTPKGDISWPPADGFAGTPVLMILPPGMLIDRFGSDGGRFFSPKGAAYGARALPYSCEKLAYVTYRVVQPLLAWAGKAAAWFDAPGGATQLETDAPAYLLISDHIIEAVPHPGAQPCN